MTYYIQHEMGLTQKKKIARIKELLKQKRFEHWDSSRKTGVSRYKREEELDPSLQLVFHYDMRKPCEFKTFEKDMKAMVV